MRQEPPLQQTESFVGEAWPPEIAQHSALTESELVVPPCEDGSSWSRTSGTTSVDVSAVAKPVSEVRPLGFVKYSGSAESDVAVSYCEDGPPWSRTSGNASADVTTVVKPVDKARPPGIVKYSASTESQFAKSSDEAGSSRIKAHGTNSAATTAVVKSSDEARPRGFAKYHVTSESESESEPAEFFCDTNRSGNHHVCKVGKEANPDGEQLIFRICHVVQASQRCLAVFSKVLALEQELVQGCLRRPKTVGARDLRSTHSV